MEKHIVALVPAESYDQPLVDAALRQGLALLGGIGRFIRKEERILIKPNLLARAPADKAITTHPAVFSALCRLLREEGYSHLSYGDSPGNPTTTPEKAAEGSGIGAMAAQFGIPQADFSTGSIVPFPQGKTAKSFYLCKGVQEADAYINLCKMKTHALERITGAIKNQYGCITGVNKAAGHADFPNSEIFAEMLTDLNRCIAPRLHIMDGIIAMEGNGPASGTPTPMKVLLLSDDPVALDTVFASLIHLSPSEVPTCVSGAKGGLGVMDEDRITVRTPDRDLTVAEARETYGRADFDVYRGKLMKGILSHLQPLQPLLQHRPKVDLKKCVGCGVCEEACPVEGKAVHSGKGQKAKYDYAKCIRCYCCQEMCPVKAIEVHRPLITRLLSGK